MAANPTGPFALALGQTTTLAYPQDSLPTAAVVIDNLSPFALKIQIGPRIVWLPPFQENVYRLPENRTSVTATPYLVPGAPPITSAAGVLATWYGPDDGLPGGTWPMALTGPALLDGLYAGSPAGELAGVQVLNTLAVPGYNSLITVGSGTEAIRLWAWSINFDLLTPPVSGTADLDAFVAGSTPGPVAVDSVSPQSPGSSRVAGLLCSADAPNDVLGVTLALGAGVDANVTVLYTTAPT
jgi:hypothetical protein